MPIMSQRELREAVISRDKRTCQYCGKPRLYKRQLHLDHVVPTSEGGQNSFENLVVACSACNKRKRAASAEAYATKRLEELKREEEFLRKLLNHAPAP